MGCIGVLCEEYNNYTCTVKEAYCGKCDLFLGHMFEDAVEKGDTSPDCTGQFQTHMICIHLLQDDHLHTTDADVTFGRLEALAAIAVIALQSFDDNPSIRRDINMRKLNVFFTILRTTPNHR